MAKIVNHTDQVVKFSTGHVVPAKGELADVSSKTLDFIFEENYPNIMLRTGAISVAQDAPQEPNTSLTREDVAVMSRTELIRVGAEEGGFKKTAMKQLSDDQLREAIVEAFLSDV